MWSWRLLSWQLWIIKEAACLSDTTALLVIKTAGSLSSSMANGGLFFVFIVYWQMIILIQLCDAAHRLFFSDYVPIK